MSLTEFVRQLDGTRVKDHRQTPILPEEEMKIVSALHQLGVIWYQHTEFNIFARVNWPKFASLAALESGAESLRKDLTCN